MRILAAVLPSLLHFALWPCEGRRRHHSELSTSAYDPEGSRYNEKDEWLRSRKTKVLVPPSREDHLVTDLPLLLNADDVDSSAVFQTRHYAGHIPLDYEVDDKAFFYWLFEADFSDRPKNNNLSPGNGNDDDDSVPLLIWLNGGPACSSMDGLFLENGPFRLTNFSTDMSSAKIELNPYSWHKIPAHVVYIDQPVGTGLSYSKGKNWCTNDAEINTDFYVFMQNFLKVHAELFLNEDGTKTRRKVYFSGESHAGHYIPSMMKFISDANTEIESSGSSSKIFIDIEGAAIGNGWTDPYHQYAGAEAAYGAGIIDLSQKRALDEKEKQCQSQLDKGNLNVKVCMDLVDAIVAQSNTGQGHVLVYDNRKYGVPFPPGKYDVERYLGGDKYANSSDQQKNLSMKVLESIHATEAAVADQHYLECTDPPYFALRHQDGLGVIPQVESLLERNIRLLFFNGMNDLICNHVGNEVLIEKLNWSKIDEWKMSKRYIWRSNNAKEPTGYMREYANLSYLKLREAGHMVPMDQPEVALSMIRLFLQKQSFATVSQALDSSSREGDACPVCPMCHDESSPQESIDRPKKEVSDVDTEVSQKSSIGNDSIVIKRTHFIAGAWIAVLCLSVISVIVLKAKSNLSPSNTTAPVYKVTQHSEHEFEGVDHYLDDHENLSSDPARFRID